jgi:hypothetical protein
MQRVSLKTMLVAVVLFSGCATIEEWTAGTITEGIPRMRDKLPRTAKIYFADPVNARGYELHEQNRRRVQDSFGKSLDALGVANSTKTNGCSHVLHVVVDNWQYGDGALFGFGESERVDMSVMLQDVETARVLNRATLSASDLDLLVLRYVRTLFKDGK